MDSNGKPNFQLKRNLKESNQISPQVQAQLDQMNKEASLVMSGMAQGKSLEDLKAEGRDITFVNVEDLSIGQKVVDPELMRRISDLEHTGKNRQLSEAEMKEYRELSVRVSSN
jgi:hypothetical protein